MKGKDCLCCSGSIPPGGISAVHVGSNPVFFDFDPTFFRVFRSSKIHFLVFPLKKHPQWYFLSFFAGIPDRKRVLFASNTPYPVGSKSDFSDFDPTPLRPTYKKCPAARKKLRSRWKRSFKIKIIAVPYSPKSTFTASLSTLEPMTQSLPVTSAAPVLTSDSPGT